MGLLYKLVKGIFGIGSYVRTNPVTQTVALTATRIAKNNPDRVGIIVSNVGSNTIYLGTGSDVSSTNGIPLFSGGSISMKYDQDFESLGEEIWGIASVAASTVYVRELVGYSKPGERE